MKIFVTVNKRNSIYHKICKAGEELIIGSGENAVPLAGLEHGEIRIALFEDDYEISGRSIPKTEKTQLQLGEPFSIEESDLFILAEVYRGFAGQEYPLPYEGVYQFGRGKKNDVVITEPHRYVSSHHFKLTAENGMIRVEDCNSKNGLFLNGTKILTAKIVPGDVLSILDVRVHYEGSHLRFENASIQFEEEEPEESTEKILITRAPRLKQELPHGSIQIDPPPSPGNKPEPNWLAILLPAGITIAIAIVLATFLNSSMMMVYSLPMTVGGIIVSVVNYSKQRKQYDERTEVRQKKYADYLEEKEKILLETAEKQLVAMRNADPETRGCMELVKKHPERIWQRRPEDEDFACVRIGSGNVGLSVKVTGPQETLSLEEDPLKKKAAALVRQYREIREAPIVCDLSDGSVCGAIGKTEDIQRFTENLLVNLCTQHCYTELQVVCLYNSENEEEFGWIRKLPHVWDSGRKACHIATNKEDAQALFSRFSDFLKQRKNEIDEESSYGTGPVFLPHYVFLILEPAFLKKTHPVNQYLLHGNGLGVSLMMAAEKYSQLPKECGTILELKGDSGVIYQTSSASDKHDFQLDLTDAKEMKRFAKKMERLCVEESADKGGAIPANYSFFDMLGIRTPAELSISGNWKRADALRSLAAPIGVGEDGKLVILDIDESKHGPHGLVAGTTGSGKSELLQSYLLALAVRYHPYDLNFLLIDYKGGGMANQFTGLPHLAGSITNLEENELEINRALAALEGEKLRRQKLFAKAGVRTIQDYMAAWKQGRVSVPIPRLIIVVDEFAELKKQRPDFMEALTSTSRIGRSLGIHLILATQKPSGVVSDDIRANSKFRICLKVMNASESKEVINSALAAKIREPGRAYLRVGEGDLFELFQSGYSGYKMPSGATQFHEVLKEIRNCWEMQALPSLPPICLPPLEKQIPYVPQPGEQSLAVGLLDDPERQVQKPYSLPLFGGNTLIVGSAQTGKTTLLQTLLRRIADGFSPQEVSVYILDFASKTMKTFEPLPHVGGVVTAEEDEKLGYLIQMLLSELERRRKLFLTEGISSFEAYREIGKSELPYLVLMIDNLSAVKELYFQEHDSLLTILQSGPGLGVSVVATNFLASSIWYKYLPAFSERIALFCNDSGEYAAAFEGCRKKFSLIPGRCLVGSGKEQFFCQIYLPFEGERELERVNAIDRFLREAEMRWPQPALPIPSIPEHLTGDEVLSRYKDFMNVPGEVVLGLNYADVLPYVLDLRKQGLLAIGGKSGKSAVALLRHIIRTCTELHPGRTVFYLADSITRELEILNLHADIGSYSFLPDKAAETIATVERELQFRYQALSKGDRNVLDNSPTLVLVLNGQEVMETVSRDSVAMTAYNNILGKYRSLNICVILLNPENKAIFNKPEVLSSVKDNLDVIMFEDLINVQLTRIDYTMNQKFRKPVDAGTGYYISGGFCDKIKFAVEE